MNIKTTSNGIKRNEKINLLEGLQPIKYFIHEKINFKSNLLTSDNVLNCRSRNMLILWTKECLQFSKEMPTQTRPHHSRYSGRGIKKNEDVVFYSKF